MSALHWICAVTLALVCCLNAQPVKRHTEEKNTLLGLIDDFKPFTNASECTNNTKPYSPSDIREECVNSAVNCILEGLTDIERDCGIDEEKTELAYGFYEGIYTGLKNKWDVTPRPDCDCELYPQKSIEDFLNDVKELVQRL